MLRIVAEVLPPSSSTSPWVYLLAAMLGGGLITTLWQVVQRLRRGKLEDSAVVAQINHAANSDLKGILDEYRLEVEVVKRHVDDYRIQLHELTKALAAATLRIAQLEFKLENSETNQEHLRAELVEARAARASLEQELISLRAIIAATEAQAK